MIEPLAYFITFTTYGTWLPGDERGWVDAKTAAPDAPIRPPDAERYDQARRKLRQPVVKLSGEFRQIVMKTVKEVCDYRGWTLHAVNCRSNHLHVVLTARDVTPERVMNQLKSWCSRRLNDHLGDQRREDWWTRHGSTRYLNTEAEVAEKVDYVLNRQ